MRAKSHDAEYFSPTVVKIVMKKVFAEVID